MKAVSGSLSTGFGNNSFYASHNFLLVSSDVSWKEQHKLELIARKIGAVNKVNAFILTFIRRKQENKKQNIL